MEAKLKDGSILYVDAEERIYAQGIPGGPFPLVIDQAGGERLLIEFAEQQQQEIERYKEYTEHLQQEIQWQYGKLNQISDLIEKGRNESKKLFPGNTR